MTYPPATPPTAALHEPVLAALAALPVEPLRLQRAGEVGALVQELTGDDALSIGALLHAALGGAPGRGADHAAIREAAGSRAQKLAAALARLGDFDLDAHWSRDQGLSGDQAETLRKMLLAVVGDPRLVVARIAAQLIRVRHARELDADARRRIALETRDLYAPLANRLGIWSLKWELEDLAFRELNPDDYRRIAAALNSKRADREAYIERVREQLARALAEAGVAPAEVTGRPKHIYSIWRKMQAKQLPFEQLFDVRAVRVIVGTIADCYAALGVVHSLWEILPGEFDDYIATPKANDYRSIHTAVAGPEGLSLEVQIRTREMQQQAERGVAAHWRYKEGGRGAQDYEQKIEAVRELLERSGSDGDDALAQASAGLFSDRIYALTPKGEVVDLPNGATPLDFAFHVHSDLGQRCRGAKINGRIVPLDTRVANGDVVEVITARNATPSRDWLAADSRYLVSARSRSKLRAYFRRLDESAAPAATPAPAGEETAPAAPTELPLRTPRRRAPTGRSRSPVDIEGVGDLPVILAQCCAPVRPQPIDGYLTLARGVTIHRADCASFARMVAEQPERRLKVEWASGDAASLPVTVTLLAYDRRGLLRDITDLIAEERLSIEGVSSDTDPEDRIATITVRLTVPDVAGLARLIQRLRQIPNVFEVRRSR